MREAVDAGVDNEQLRAVRRKLRQGDFRGIWPIRERAVGIWLG